MKDNKNSLEELFAGQQGKWDSEEPTDGHELRFMDRLENNSSKQNGIFWRRVAISVAAAIALLSGIFLLTYSGAKNTETKEVATVSKEVRETQLYFTNIIRTEMAKIEREESTPETKKIVRDALYRMEDLEKDYKRLTKELTEKGEDKKIIHAMITNLQIRISFLEEVLIKIDNIKKIKKKYHESNKA